MQSNDVQYCVSILEKAVASSAASTMLIALPADMAMKMVPSLPSPEILAVRCVYEEGAEVQLELKEKEKERVVLFMEKESMKERCLSSDERFGLKSRLAEFCGEEVATKCVSAMEKRLREGAKEGYEVFDVSKKVGVIGV